MKKPKKDKKDKKGKQNKNEKKHTKYRSHRKIDEVPKDIKNALDIMLEDTSITYTEITDWLNNELKQRNLELVISRSAVGRYSMETKKLSSRLLENMEQMRELVKLAKSNDEGNVTEGALQLATYKLTEKIALADEEIEAMPISRAIELAANISRTKAYKDKIYTSLKSEYEKGYEQFKKRINNEIAAHPELVKQLERIANETVGKLAPKKD